MARPFHHPAAEDISIDGILYALSDPSRRDILFNLMGCEGMNCGQACEGLPPSTVSFHFTVLREAGLIHSEKKGVQVVNTARKAEIDERFPGLLHSIFQHHRKHKE